MPHDFEAPPFRAGRHHPIHGFREKMIRQVVGLRVVGNRNVTINTFKNCWNAFAKKEPLRGIKFIKSSVDIDGLDVSKL